MRLQDSIWQGNFGYWQYGFIHSNILMIGYFAWKGFLELGRGITVCHVVAEVTESKTTSLDLMKFNPKFVGRSQIIPQVQPYGLDQRSMAQLLTVVETYDPDRDVVLLLAVDAQTAHPQTEISLLQNLTVPPSQCYEQVSRRWDEFQLCLL